MKNIKHWMLVAGECLIAAGLIANVAHAIPIGGGGGGGLIPVIFYDTTDPRMPSPAYLSTNPVSYTNGSAIFMIDSFFDVFTDLERVPPPSGGPGTTELHSFFDVFLEMDTNSNILGPVHIRESPTRQTLSMTSLNGLPPGVPWEFDTEMLSLDITGTGAPGGLPAGFKIRESPTLQSLGHTSITDLGGGNYRIGSFFDIFTELSLDNGASWMPSSGPMHLSGGLAPTSVVPELSSCLVWLVGSLAFGYFRPSRAS